MFYNRENIIPFEDNLDSKVYNSNNAMTTEHQRRMHGNNIFNWEWI